MRKLQGCTDGCEVWGAWVGIVDGLKDGATVEGAKLGGWESTHVKNKIKSFEKQKEINSVNSVGVLAKANHAWIAQVLEQVKKTILRTMMYDGDGRKFST